MWTGIYVNSLYVDCLHVDGLHVDGLHVEVMLNNSRKFRTWEISLHMTKDYLGEFVKNEI